MTTREDAAASPRFGLEHRYTEQELEIMKCLHSLGITANYSGFYYTTYATTLVIDNPSSIMLVTKRLYPETARHFRVNAACVERNIRTVSAKAWDAKRTRLESIAGKPLDSPLSSSKFIAALVNYCLWESC